MLNVFAWKDILVSVVKETPEKVTFITSSGDIKEVLQKDAIVTAANLIPAGIYNERFLQAALGGLTQPPKYVAKTGGVVSYRGKLGNAFAEPMGRDMVKYAVGIDNNSLPDAAKGPRNEMRVGPGKEVDYDKQNIFQEDGRKDNGKKIMDDIDNLDALGEDTPETLNIADDSVLGNIQSIVLKWTNPKIDGSIQDIKELFGEGKLLPAPDSMTIDTGEEKITSKRRTVTPSSPAGDTAITASVKTAGAMDPLNPVMSHTCKKCQALNMYKYDDKAQLTKTVCSVCGFEERYERDEKLQREVPIEARGDKK